MIVFQTESRTRMSQIVVTHCYVTSKERMLGRLTSRKRPPKMYRLSGRLREVVAYKNRTSRGLFREEVEAHLLYGR